MKAKASALISSILLLPLLLGIGIVTRQAHWRSIGQIILSWLITLPCGAVLAALSVWIIALRG